MSYCEGCHEERMGVEHVTVSIHYSLGPIMAALCKSCRDDEVDVDPAVPVMAIIREM